MGIFSNFQPPICYNTANQITNAGFTYDANGNLTSDGNFIYTYNALNQLVQVNRVSNGSLVATYSYNHNGLRKSKTVNGATTNYSWDASGNLIREVTPTGTNYYYYVGGKLVGLKKNNTTYVVHDNLRGDIESITDTTGNIVAQSHYDPWGNQITYSGSLTQPFRYAGYYYDDETGSYYLKSRYYSPALGRFLTRDSIKYTRKSDPQTLNLYSYARNNPISFVDPNGNSIISAILDKANKLFNAFRDTARRDYHEADRLHDKGVSGVNIFLGAVLSEIPRSDSKQYAKEHKYYTSTGDLKTWENPADALRHFEWNVLMTRVIGANVAETIATNHEFGNDVNSSATQQDLHNNSVGRAYGSNPDYASYSAGELFDIAVANGALQLWPS